MTKFKQGEMPVCNNPHQHNLDILNPPHVCSLCGGGNFLNAVSKEPPALRPASPKWEPKVGELVEGESPITNKKYSGNYIGVDPNKLEEHIISNKDTNDCYAVINIRPIAPSPEEELEKILEGVTFEVTRGETIKLIMQWHNRHKEGERI